MPEEVIWVEDWNWYDWVAFFLDERTWQRYSRNWHPIANNEMCKYGKIYEVEMIRDGDWAFDYHFKILSERLDQEPTS